MENITPSSNEQPQIINEAVSVPTLENLLETYEELKMRLQMQAQ